MVPVVLMQTEGYYEVSRERHSPTHTLTHTHRGCFECAAVADHLYLHLTFPPFVSLQLSVSGLSACRVFFSLLSFLYSPSIPPFHVFPAPLFFHSVSCHCLSALSHSQHSSLSPSLASFFSVSPDWSLSRIPLPPTHLLVFSFDLYPPFSL